MRHAEGPELGKQHSDIPYKYIPPFRDDAVQGSLQLINRSLPESSWQIVQDTICRISSGTLCRRELRRTRQLQAQAVLLSVVCQNRALYRTEICITIWTHRLTRKAPKSSAELGTLSISAQEDAPLEGNGMRGGIKRRQRRKAWEL
jgi:hypothetical protein